MNESYKMKTDTLENDDGRMYDIHHLSLDTGNPMDEPGKIH